MDFQPINVLGLITEEVGSPRNDGGPGSALYSVPIRLSRPLHGDEAEVFVHLWDQPPSFTTMHRPGIGRVTGDRFVLDGTTVDEVAKYHATTIRAVVERFNVEMADIRQRQNDAASAAASRDAEHRRHVDEVANDIRFE